jgi:hypothetical protein
MRDARIRGTAMSLREFIKIVPKGLIQSFIKPEPQEKPDKKRAKRIPAAIPIRIFQCRAIFLFFNI